MDDAVRTAQVVLQPSTSTSTPPERAAVVPPPAGEAEQVAAWFREHGFETGPVVGTSFAITGDDDAFARCFGEQCFHAAHQQAGELPLADLDEDVCAHVAAVVTTAPPDFGPGNP